MAHDVFISHSVKDKVTADAVCAVLEAEGVRCWIAPRDVLPSMEWSTAIVDAIEESRIIVLVFTANANASPQIRREVECAVNHGVPILPVRIEDVLPTKALEYFIGNVHWLDALTPPVHRGSKPAYLDPEVDFFQDLGGSRQTFSASLHAGPDGNGSCCVISSPTQDNNGTQWHTYGVEWTPTSIVYTIDGRQWGSTINRNQLGSPAQWPTIPMNLTLQSQNQGSAQPANGTETMTVAWVAEYTANG